MAAEGTTGPPMSTADIQLRHPFIFRGNVLLGTFCGVSIGRKGKTFRFKRGNDTHRLICFLPFGAALVSNLSLVSCLGDKSRITSVSRPMNEIISSCLPMFLALFVNVCQRCFADTRQTSRDPCTKLFRLTKFVNVC